MSITINAVAGDSTANSYATLEEATAYFNSLPGMSWNETGTTDDVRKEALVVATRMIDQLKFVGAIYGSSVEGSTNHQVLQWPRKPANASDFYATEDRTSGLPITRNATGELIVPRDIRVACMEQANYLISSQSGIGEVSDRTRLQREGVQSLSVPGLMESYAQMGGKSKLAFLCPEAIRLLASHIKRGGTFHRA